MFIINNNLVFNFIILIVGSPIIIYLFVKECISYKNNYSNKYLVDIYINNNLYTNTNNGNIVTSFSSNDMIGDDVKKIDIDYEILIQKIDYSFLKDILIPEDLNNREYKEVYIKKDNNSGYNLLQNYEVIYKDNNDRSIVMLISDKDESNKNESLEGNIKISKINGVEVVIYQDESLYKVNFIYNDKSFNIRTNSVSKEELVNLLSSIIK